MSVSQAYEDVGFLTEELNDAIFRLQEVFSKMFIIPASITLDDGTIFAFRRVNNPKHVEGKAQLWTLCAKYKEGGDHFHPFQSIPRQLRYRFVEHLPILLGALYEADRGERHKIKSAIRSAQGLLAAVLSEE